MVAKGWWLGEMKRFFDQGIETSGYKMNKFYGSNVQQSEGIQVISDLTVNHFVIYICIKATHCIP